MIQKISGKGKRFVKYVAVTILLLPVSAVAFLGIGDSSDGILAAMLTQLQQHTTTLVQLFEGIDFIDMQIANMRHRIEDPFELLPSGLRDRVNRIKEFIPENIALFSHPLTQGLQSFEETVRTIETVWGRNSNTDYGKILRFKDYIPTYTLGQTALIEEESEGFAQAGETLLDDLHTATEGKATVRGAQAEALQIQQLAQIESNQALQISLQSQQVLSDNEREKGLHELTGTYLEMLSKSYQQLTSQE